MAAPDTPAGARPRAGFRRVLVALDSSAASSPVLEIAAGIAAANTCELCGLFVEDQDLLRLAGLPFAREIQLSKAMSRTLAPEQLLQDLRAQAGLARTAMARQAALHRVSWSFQVAQGRSEEAILLAATAGDIIAMARGFGPLASVARLSRRVRLIAARAPGPLLLAGEPSAGRPGPVLLPYDASPAAKAMLGIAVDLARARGEALEIMLFGDAAERGAEVEARLRSAADERRLPALRLWAPRDAATALRRLMEADGGLLVLPADAPWFTPGRIEQIIERARPPIVLQTESTEGAGGSH
jgi:nucleotide-binding universal stress UspA family protein